MLFFCFDGNAQYCCECVQLMDNECETTTTVRKGMPLYFLGALRLMGFNSECCSRLCSLFQQIWPAAFSHGFDKPHDPIPNTSPAHDSRQALFNNIITQQRSSEPWILQSIALNALLLPLFCKFQPNTSRTHIVSELSAFWNLRALTIYAITIHALTSRSGQNSYTFELTRHRHIQPSLDWACLQALSAQIQTANHLHSKLLEGPAHIKRRKLRLEITFSNAISDLSLSRLYIYHQTYCVLDESMLYLFVGENENGSPAEVFMSQYFFCISENNHISHNPLYR